MKTIKINLYKFEELSKEAKQIALEKFSDINVNYDWWKFTYEDAKNVGLKLKGFGLDRDKHAEGEFTLSANEVAQNILNEHGEKCETYKTTENFMSEWQPIFSDYMDEKHKNYESKESEDKLIDLEAQFLKDILKDYATMLQNECEYLQTEESIIETIEANDYDFTIDGKLY